MSVSARSIRALLRLQWPVLVSIAVVWALRLGLSLAGAPVAGTKLLSVTVVLVLGTLFYGWTLGRAGSGSFRELFALNLIQSLFSQALVAAAILLAVALDRDNIFSIPEFYPPAQGIGILGLPMPPHGRSLGHAVEHVVVAGLMGFPLIGWLLGSVVLLLSRRGAARERAPELHSRP